jgi:hypothetical protein
MLFSHLLGATIFMLAGLAASQSQTLFFTKVPHSVQVGQVYSINYDAPDLASVS